MIAVATSSEPIVEINGVERIEGSLEAVGNPELTTIASDSLHTITDAMEISSLPVLTNMTFPQLTRVGKIAFEAIPNPTVVKVGSNSQQVSQLYVRNTSLAYFSNLFTLSGAQIEVLEIVHNPYLVSQLVNIFLLR